MLSLGRLVRAILLPLVVAGGCACGLSGDEELRFAAYTTPREAYGKSVLPAFAARWHQRTGRELRFSESYLGSGAQARAIAGGFEADVAALALEPDVEALVREGLVDPGWSSEPHRGMVTRSLVVIGVREGNPEKIRSWEDLARPGLSVLAPNVRSSGGARWSVLAIYGAAVRRNAGTGRGDRDAATELLASIFRNVEIMDRSARASMLTFERGVGDAIITYENEILVGRARGMRYDYVIPPSTILIENPIAVVDAYAERHGARELARAFVEFTRTPEAQRMFAEHGLRPVLDSVIADTRRIFPVPPDLFTIRELGGWEAAEREVFAVGGVYERALERSRASR